MQDRPRALFIPAAREKKVGEFSVESGGNDKRKARPASSSAPRE
jgi:hypothetical protein